MSKMLYLRITVYRQPELFFKPEPVKIKSASRQEYERNIPLAADFFKREGLLVSFAAAEADKLSLLNAVIVAVTKLESVNVIRR